MTVVNRIAFVGVVAFALVFTGSVAVASDDLERRVQRLENILDGDQLVELLEEVRDVQEQMRELRGEIQEQNHRLSRLEQRQRNLYADLDERIRDLELATDRPAAAAPDTVEQAAADQGAGAEGDEREAYQQAFNTLREGRYEAAAERFQAFLDNHGDSDYAANARYWLGEAHYVSRDFEAALEHFERVLADYPDSSKAPDALLKVGYTHFELDNRDAAREALERVKDQYSGSSVGRLAEERLVRMREDS